MIFAEVRINAQFYHLDPLNIVWHGHYAEFLEQARCELLDKLDYSYDKMAESGYIWPIIDMRIKYVKPITFQQEVVVRATLKEFESRLKIDYLITDLATGDRLTRAHTIQLAVEAETGEMCFESPAILREKIGRLS
jgi:acyl-CoA thioester hydrolase